MQVRKFEAKSMKEALELVKRQMGPDAIILSAKDSSRGFGLAGQNSVEITAAVTEETLRKRKFVESRIRPQDQERMQQAPARVQRQFIDSMVDKYAQESVPRKEITQRRYVEIADQEGSSQAPTNSAPATPPGQKINISLAEVTQKASSSQSSTNELQSLRAELAQLKHALTNFQKVPQTIAGSHPGAEFGLPYEFSAMFERLRETGVATDIAGEILQEAVKQMPPIRYKSKGLIDGWVAKHILETTLVVGENTGTRVQLFMGPAGSGKTSSLVKLASHYVVHGRKKVALVTTDTLKVGAADQLRIYAQILNVPFTVIRNGKDWDYIGNQLRGYDYILCDCPGMGLKNIEEIHHLKSILPLGSRDLTRHLVLNSTAKDADLADMGKRYKSLNFDDVIFTALDDSLQHGAIFNFMRNFKTPLHSFGLGPRVPEDFEMATRERVLDLLFKLTKMRTHT